MTDPGTGALRVLRALVLLSTVTGLVLAAHVLGGGDASVASVASLAALLWPVCLTASARRIRLPALLGGLAGGQVAGHAVLSAFASSRSLAAACLEHLGHGGHGGHTPSLACHAQAGAALADHAMADHAMAATLVPSTGMVASHVAATVVTAILLARGDAVLWRVLDLVVRPVPRLVPLRAAAASLGGVLRPAVATPSGPLPLGRAPPVAA